MTRDSKKVQAFISLCVNYVLSLMIFNPLFKSDNIFISLIIFTITGFLSTIFISKIYSRRKNNIYTRKALFSFLSTVSYILAFVCVLLLLTEAIRDVSYVTNSKISLGYFITLALCLLFVSFYLCCKSEKGIYRFLILCIVPVLIISFLPTLSFIETKGIGFNISERVFPLTLKSVGIGFLTGVFACIDLCVFLNCFESYVSDNRKVLYSKEIVSSFIFACILISILLLCANLIFGPQLLQKLSMPLYGSLKLIPGFDLTEMVSVIKITAFIVKSSQYAYCVCKNVKNIFNKNENVLIFFIISFYVLIPITFIGISFLAKNLKYGAFQSYIYPAVILLGLFILAIDFFCRKKD